MKRIFMIAVLVTIFTVVTFCSNSMALSAKGLDAEVDGTLELFEATKGANGMLDKAKGVLIFPSIVKAGFGIGGEYGEGSLRIDGKTEGYYNTVAASIGFQIGVQKKSIIIAFMRQAPLDKFLNSSGWKIGADASIAVIAVGADGGIDTATYDEPIIAFVFDQKGLMYNLTLEGAKITKIKK
ncbi:MAG: hypothetical protein KAI70_02180 [Candidatus Omnitrophica bacterium]|nr:hypothetical protein [Candidatus Omnitrophota bacterium]